MTLSRRIVAEGLGTAFLLAAALLTNTLATGATLITLIFTFGPISGAHFNPASPRPVKALHTNVNWGIILRDYFADILRDRVSRSLADQHTTFRASGRTRQTAC
jgi:glycerol uptake facilitator-like aquaporin